jgi:hypothetical protein
MTEKVTIEVAAEELKTQRSEKIEESTDLSAAKEKRMKKSFDELKAAQGAAKISDAQISDEMAQVIDKDIDEIEDEIETDEGDEELWQAEMKSQLDRIEKLAKKGEGSFRADFRYDGAGKVEDPPAPGTDETISRSDHPASCPAICNHNVNTEWCSWSAGLRRSPDDEGRI